MSYGLFHAVAVTALVQSLDPTMEEFSVGESTVLKPTHGPLAPVCEQLNAACFFGLHRVLSSRPGVARGRTLCRNDPDHVDAISRLRSVHLKATQPHQAWLPVCSSSPTK